MRLGAMPAITAAATYFALVFSAGFAFGMLRVTVLAPVLGERIAVLAELPPMLYLCWIACRWTLRVHHVPAEPGARLVMGGVAFALLLLAEAALSVLVFGRSLQAHLGLYLGVPALTGLVGQGIFALFPVLAVRFDALKEPSA